MDVHGIPLGVNFRAYLNEQVGKAELLIALIADRWLSAKDEHGARRIDSPNDFVRIEIEAALTRGIPVVPVYADDAKFLREADLPDSLKDLAWMNGYNLSTDGSKFAASIAALIAGLDPHFTPPQPEPQAPKPAQPAPKPQPLKPEQQSKPPQPAIVRPAPESFRDGDAAWAPEMAMIPPGEFPMGSPAGEGSDNERPQHKVAIPKAFAVGKYPVTFAEWDAYVSDGGGLLGFGKRYSPADAGWGRGRRPVINVSWDDAQAYVKWLSQKTRRPYRLLSEAEWEYACRAGSTTAYSFGDSDNDLGLCAWFYGNAGGRTHPVGEKKPNAFGLYDMHGNVWEWCEDCWNGNYNGAPADGSAWTTRDRSYRVLRGGSWSGYPPGLRSAFRLNYSPDYRFNNVGFRVART